MRAQAVEPRIRHALAAHLGLEADDLEPEVTFDDDLGLEPTEVLELVQTLEGELGITVSEREIDAMRTCGDLVHVAACELAEQCRVRRDGGACWPCVWVRISSPSTGVLERAVELTPYAAEEIVDDVRHAGASCEAEVVVPLAQPGWVLSEVERLLARSRTCGAMLTVRRGDDVGH